MIHADSQAGSPLSRPLHEAEKNSSAGRVDNVFKVVVLRPGVRRLTESTLRVAGACGPLL